MKTVDFSETIEAYDLNVGRCRQLQELMKVCENQKHIKTCSSQLSLDNF